MTFPNDCWLIAGTSMQPVGGQRGQMEGTGQISVPNIVTRGTSLVPGTPETPGFCARAKGNFYTMPNVNFFSQGKAKCH